MAYDARKNCVFCAWRGNCDKRFSIGSDASLHCADFSEDLLLRKQQTDECGDENSPKDY